MINVKTLLVAAPVALGLLAAPAAHAEWRGGGGGYHGGYHEGYRGHGFPLVGALLGLGAAAVAGGIIASQAPVYYAPPPVYYAPPPVYYGPPAYARPYYDAPAYSQ